MLGRGIKKASAIQENKKKRGGKVKSKTSTSCVWEEESLISSLLPYLEKVTIHQTDRG